MSSTSRNPFWPDVTTETGPRTRFALKIAQSAIQQHDDTLVELNNKVTSLQTATATTQTAAHTAENIAINARNVASHQPVWDVIHLNDRTEYKTQESDRGCLLLIDYDEAVTVILSTRVHAPWFVAIKNISSPTAILRSETGEINKSGSYALESGKSEWLFWDGVNWWTLP